jgi:hypothetical protein
MSEAAELGTRTGAGARGRRDEGAGGEEARDLHTTDAVDHAFTDSNTTDDVCEERSMLYPYAICSCMRIPPTPSNPFQSVRLQLGVVRLDPGSVSVVSLSRYLGSRARARRGGRGMVDPLGEVKWLLMLE